MDEELEKTSEVNNSIETVSSEQKVETTPKPASVLSLEEMKKSEKEVRVAPAIQGVAEVETKVEPTLREFAKKSDERKAFAKKRLKIVTTVYLSVVAMLLLFVGVNVVALASMSTIIKNNETITATKQEELSEVMQDFNEETLGGTPFEISLNEPRDYSEDRQELTFFDKITIIFRNLFG